MITSFFSVLRFPSHYCSPSHCHFNSIVAQAKTMLKQDLTSFILLLPTLCLIPASAMAYQLNPPGTITPWLCSRISVMNEDFLINIIQTKKEQKHYNKNITTHFRQLYGNVELILRRLSNFQWLLVVPSMSHLPDFSCSQLESPIPVSTESVWSFRFNPIM